MNVLTLARRELGAYFATASGWLVIAAFQLLSGYFFTLIQEAYVSTANNLVFNPYGGSDLNLTDDLIGPYFQNTLIILMLVGPALSMRLYSLEFQTRTIELLFTSPISTWEIVLGKFLGALGMAGILLLSTAHYSLTLAYYGTPDYAVLVSGHLAMLLVLAGVIAIGSLVSASTDSQLVALVFTFVISLMLYILAFTPAEAQLLGLPLGEIAQQISLSTHAQALMRGELKLSDLVYFGSFVAVLLFATHQRVESHRWS